MAGPWSTIWGQGLWTSVTQGSVITGGVICFSKRVGLGGQDLGNAEVKVEEAPGLRVRTYFVTNWRGDFGKALPLRVCFYHLDCPLRCSVASENPCVSLKKKNPVPASHVRPIVLTLVGVGSEVCSLVQKAHLLVFIRRH